LKMDQTERTALAAPKGTIPALAMDEQTLLTVLENSLYPGAQSSSIALVVNYCRAAGLDPMMKPVHIVPMWDSKSGRPRDVIMPGIGLYRTQAARSGQYAGVTEPEYGPDVTEKIGGVEITYPAWCKVTVKRSMLNGQIAEFAGVERWKENYAVKGGKEKSVAPNAMWTRRPYAQLAKCASAQALRSAFPELVGAQATADEMEGRVLEHDITPEPPKQPVDSGLKGVPDYSDEQFQKNLPVWTKLILSGKKTALELMVMIATKGLLSAQQKTTLMAIKAAPSVVTFDQVVKKIEAADDIDLLDAAADLIGEVTDQKQRADLTALYYQCKTKIQGE